MVGVAGPGTFRARAVGPAADAVPAVERAGAVPAASGAGGLSLAAVPRFPRWFHDDQYQRGV